MNRPSAEKIMQDCTWSVLVDLKLQTIKQGLKDVQYYFWYDEGNHEGENEIAVMKYLSLNDCIKVFGDGKPYFEIYNISEDEDQNKNGFLFYRFDILDKFFKVYNEYSSVYSINEGLVNEGNLNLKKKVNEMIIKLNLKRKQKLLINILSNGKSKKTSELVTKTNTKKLSSLIRDVNKKIIKHGLRIICLKKKVTNRDESTYQIVSHN